ncbi:hypothetical protein MUN89_07530 [Halobacillus salinarum]|uniref:Uncharacterized protein n=1 Tax=Halobacillus salinarum TaxID=2932257 RepID=A0ABY4EMT7_9BACI|nr:hypothetical protein [Halobacillus salinarum]UOQ45771.1 hypothetical protein MUN89_07530 [Halobacillus salinarum]
MSDEFLFLLVIVSMATWVTVSIEVVKPAKEINRRKMITLLTAGSLSTLFITITLFQSL